MYGMTTDIRLANPDMTEEYDELFGLYLALYPATRQVARALAARQARSSETDPLLEGLYT